MTVPIATNSNLPTEIKEKDQHSNQVSNTSLKGRSVSPLNQDSKSTDLSHHSPKNNDLEALYKLGLSIHDKAIGRNEAKKGIELLQQAADQGHSTAQYELARIYSIGNKTKENIPKAIELFQASTTGESTEAMFFQGILYRDGEGVKKNDVKAFELWKKASELGNKDAEVQMALCYLDGRGVFQNKQKALIILERLSRENELSAIFELAVRYFAGKGVEVNKEKVEQLMRQAVSLGISNAFLILTLQVSWLK